MFKVKNKNGYWIVVEYSLFFPSIRIVFFGNMIIHGFVLVLRFVIVVFRFVPVPFLVFGSVAIGSITVIMVSSIRRPFVTILFVHGLITVRLRLVFVIFRLVIVIIRRLVFVIVLIISAVTSV